MKLNKKRSPHALRKMDQGGKVEKKEVTPSVDRRQDVSGFYQKLYSDPRVENKVSAFFFPNQTINTVSEVLSQVHPALGDYVQGFQGQGTLKGMVNNYGFYDANEDALGANMNNPVDRYEMYLDLNKNPLVSSSTGKDIKDQEANPKWRGYYQSHGYGNTPGNEGKPLIMGLGKAQMMGANNFQVSSRGIPAYERSTTVHEMSHATDKSGLLMPESEIDFITGLQDPSQWQSELAAVDNADARNELYDKREKFAKYVSNPTEVKARLMDLRYLADKHDLDAVEVKAKDLRDLGEELREKKDVEGYRIDEVIGQLSYLYDDDAINSLLDKVW
jgi:hypothetical protein